MFYDALTCYAPPMFSKVRNQQFPSFHRSGSDFIASVTWGESMAIGCQKVHGCFGISGWLINEGAAPNVMGAQLPEAGQAGERPRFQG